MATTEVELAGPDAELEPAERRRMNALYKLACRFANADELVPKELRGEPDKVFFLMCAGEQYGLTPARSLTDLWIINGRIEPSAQVRIGVAMARGHEVEVEETSSERCVIAVRRRGRERWQRLTYTIDDARRAGALDEWVELWKSNQGGKRYRAAVHYVTCHCGRHSTEPVPDWARKEIDDGKVKRKDPWFAFPDDMLFAATARKATKRFTPDAFLDIKLNPDLSGHNEVDVDLVVAHPADYGGVDADARAGAAATDIEGQDDDIVDAEVVDSDGAPPESSPEASQEPPLAGPAFSRSFAIQVRETLVDGEPLGDDARHALITYATGGRTRSSKDVRRDEVGACFAALAALEAGELVLESDPDGGEPFVISREAV